MQIKLIEVPKQKTWALHDSGDHLGHFATGFIGYNHAADDADEDLGRNAIITGDFHIDGMSRGRSAANFNGHFRGHEEAGYQLGMAGMADLLLLIQSGTFRIVDGYISGRWTFAKQGQSVFLMPYVGA
jgi:hypothetical protein